MLVRVLIPVDGPYAPTPISGSVACELLEPEKVVGLSLVGRRCRACAGCPAGSAGQGAELDQVVGEVTMRARDRGSSAAVQPGAIAAVSALEVADPAFGAGAPLDEPAEPPGMFGVPAGGRDLGFARDGDRADPERLQVPVCGGLAITSVGGARTRHAASAPPDPADSRATSGWRLGFA